MVRNPGNVNNCRGCGGLGSGMVLGGKRGLPVAGEDTGMDSRLRGNDVHLVTAVETVQ